MALVTSIGLQNTQQLQLKEEGSDTPRHENVLCVARTLVVFATTATFLYVILFIKVKHTIDNASRYMSGKIAEKQ